MSGAAKTLAWTAGAAVLLTAIAAATPLLFREIDAFRVARVELTGARFLTAAEAMAVAGVTDTSNVFDDAAVWASALRSHALVVDVRIERRPPSALRFHVTEAIPVALVRAPSLRAVDARGRILPLDPADLELDLPVIVPQIRPGQDSALDEEDRRLVDALVTLAMLDQGLASDISEIAPARGGGVRLVLQRPAEIELLLPGVPDLRVLSQVRSALEHIREHDALPPSAAGSVGNAGARTPLRIDARYREELFVTMPERRTS